MGSLRDVRRIGYSNKLTRQNKLRQLFGRADFPHNHDGYE